MFRSVELPEPKCPVWALKLTTAGKTVYPTDCGRYRCTKCGIVKLKKYIGHLSDVTTEEVLLHKVTLAEDKVEAAKRAFRRKKSATWTIRFVDKSVLVVAEVDCGGRGWSTAEFPKLDLVAELVQTLEPRTIVRAGDFTRHWHREKEEKPIMNANVIFFGRFNSRRSVDEFLTECGEDPYDEGLKNDPLALSMKVNNLRNSTDEDKEYGQ